MADRRERGIILIEKELERKEEGRFERFKIE